MNKHKNGSPDPVKVLVISDDLHVARVWAFCLQDSGLTAQAEQFSDNTLQIWAQEIPDLIVIDLQIQLAPILEFIRKLRSESAAGILLLAPVPDEKFAVEAYRAGVDECFSGPVSPRLFIAKVRTWMRRARVVPSEVLDEVKHGGFQLILARKQLITPAGVRVRLTMLEARLMYLLMAHKGRTVNSSFLIERMWGSYGNGDNILVKNVVYRLRRKIEPDPSHPCFLLTEAEGGYRLAAS